MEVAWLLCEARQISPSVSEILARIFFLFGKGMCYFWCCEVTFAATYSFESAKVLLPFARLVGFPFHPFAKDLLGGIYF
jgi:hypothetical protein